METKGREERKGKGKVSSRAVKIIFYSLALWAVTALSLMTVDTSYAKERARYPARPLKILVPAAASGSLGGEIRAITPVLEKNLGVPVIIEYVVGAEGLICYNKINQEKPDGYTIAYFNLSSALILELTREAAKYQVKNYTPVSGWNVKNQCLVVPPNKWQTFQEFVQDAKKKPVSMASVGGHGRLQAYLLQTVLGMQLNYIPYGASGEALAAVAGQHLDSVITYAITPRPMIRAGKLRALAVISVKPDPLLPGVPNFTELGAAQAAAVATTGMFAAPPQTPPQVIAILEKAVKKTLDSAEFQKMAERVGIVPEFKSAAEIKTIIADHYEQLTKYKEYIK